MSDPDASSQSSQQMSRATAAPWAWFGSGLIGAYIGDPDTAVDHLTRAMRLSPRDPRVWQFWMGTSSFALRSVGRYEEAAKWAAKVLQVVPDSVPALLSYAMSRALAADLAEAKHVMSRALKLDPSLRVSNLPLLNVPRRRQDLHHYTEGARLAGMPE
jgi:tetratricopeptide (TPR) repeat protein